MSRVAIVGGGLSGFVAYGTLLRGGVPAEEIDVYSGEHDPAATWRRRAEAIRQQRMRSESDGHCLPTSFPGLAVREALQHRDPRPLLASLCDRYRPSVADFLAQVAMLRERWGWDAAIRGGPVERVRVVDGGFELAGRSYPHVLLALGHPGLAVPDELAGDPRTVHSYEPHEYASTVTVVGAGMAAATEWRNALAAGSSVVSVRRREPERRPLNVPRPLFSRRGLAGFHALGPDERAGQLRRLLAPSYPAGRVWDEPLAAAAAEGRFSVAPAVNGSEQVICATGFRRGYAHDPLLRGLVEENELAAVDGRIVLAPDSTVPALTDSERTLSLAGAPAQWAFPAADTLVGAKYAARGFLARCRTR